MAQPGAARDPIEDRMKTNQQQWGGLKTILSKFVKNAALGGALAATIWLLKRLVPRGTPTDVSKGSSTDAEGFRETEVRIPQASLVIGSFGNEETAVDAVKSLALEWPHEYQVYSPNLNEKLFAAMELPRSPTRFWIAGGAIIGEIGGWALTIMLSVGWPHHVARMPIIAIPPFAIIAFETMVLCGVGGGVIAVLVHCRLPSFKKPIKELRRFQQDRIGIVLNCDGYAQVKRADSLLRHHGADEIQYG